ncbi:MAG: alpha/beta hydrolase [Steroidobacteraceae bacterium]
MINKMKLHRRFFAICFMALLPTAAFAQWPGIPKGWTDGYVYANGIRIHYYQAKPQPNKPTIVMAHGNSDIGLNWTTLTWKLENDYNIYMVDARGHGLTDPPSPSEPRDAMVKDLVEFIKVMGIKKPIIMGHSMGTGPARSIASDYPDLARAIILLDPGLRTRVAAPGAAANPAPAQPNPEARVAQNNTSFDDLMAKCGRDTPKWSKVDCEYWALSKKQYHGTFAANTSAASAPERTEDQLKRIKLPTLILKQDASPADRAADQAVVSALPNIKVVHIDGAGHNLHHDQLARTVEVMTKFLKTL